MLFHLPKVENQVTFLKRAVPNPTAMIALELLLVDGGALVS
jgi:hypothetical protein